MATRDWPGAPEVHKAWGTRTTLSTVADELGRGRLLDQFGFNRDLHLIAYD
jgi:hypothetical protein